MDRFQDGNARLTEASISEVPLSLRSSFSMRRAASGCTASSPVLGTVTAVKTATYRVAVGVQTAGIRC
jgi:hypothetical protein